MPTPATFSALRFENFKAHAELTLNLGRRNVLVGSNNCGKSTIIAAFRALHAGLRAANRRAAQPLRGPLSDRQLGWIISPEQLPLSLDNVHTNYNDRPATVEFRLSNGNRLSLWFPGDGQCFLFTQCQSGLVRTSAQFRKAFPVSLGVVPVLGPVDNEEEIIEPNTVTRNLSTHRASRNFRNYWHHFPEHFAAFSTLVSSTWPGMSVKPPEREVRLGKVVLNMFCSEDRFDRELYWVGFGFQIWCQLLTHIVRTRGSSVLVLDEPETYLHPDVQRQLVNILRAEHTSVVLATHSSEIIAEVEPEDLISIERGRKRGQRIASIESVQRVLDSLGSSHNLVLTRLARSRRILFVEGDDFALLSRFARRLGKHAVADGSLLTVVPIGGFDNWKEVAAMGAGLSRTLGRELAMAIVLDRDYRSDEDIALVERELREHCAIVHVLRRKELENYLLAPGPMARAVSRRLSQRNASYPAITQLECESLCLEMADKHKSTTSAQYLARRLKSRASFGEDPATLIARHSDDFDRLWSTADGRLSVVPGKQVLSSINHYLGAELHVSISAAAIIDAMPAVEVPAEISELLDALDSFCSTPWDGSSRRTLK